MPLVAASTGVLSHLGMAAAGTAIGSYTENYEFVSENLAKKLTILDTAGIRGTRSHPAERTRDGTYAVSGSINMHASPTMLGNGNSSANCILSRIMAGGAPTGGPPTNTFSFGEALPFFDVTIDRINQRFTYGNCVVNKATFRARASGILECSLDLLGESETLAATAFPALAAPTDAPYIMQDCVFTFNAISTRVITELEIVIDNHATARFSNSQTATDIYATDRTVTVNATLPWTSDYSDMYSVNTGNAHAATAVFTNGAHVLTFTFGTLQIPDNSPVISSKGEIFLKCQGTAKKTGTTSELVITSTS